MDIAVIGAGVGGLSAAIGLAAGGARVTVFEQVPQVGGKLNRWESDGFRFDTGPHVLTIRWAIDEVVSQAGFQLDDLVTLVPLETVCCCHFPSGEILTLSADLQEAAEEVGRFAPKDRLGFLQFLEYARQVSDATTVPFLRNDFTASLRTFPSRSQWKQLLEFLKLKPWKTLQDVVHDHFSDDRMRQFFELYALYSGSHPARVSGIFATVADVQWRQNSYYVLGGLYSLAEALRKVALDLGVVIKTSCRVDRVIVRGNRTVGIETQYGDRHFADAVVCNVDCLSAIPKLLPEKSQRTWNAARIARIEPSTSAFILLLGIRGMYSQLAHHNSFMSADPDTEYESLFSSGIPARDPTIGVACQSVTDPTVAPANCSNLFVMTNPPALGSGSFDWRNDAQAYREIVLDKLEVMGLSGLRNRIIVEQMWTPLDLQDRYGAWRGSIYGLSSNGWRQGFLRPPQVSPDVRGLYFVGGSTHPGGGIPLCALSGTLAARRILGHV